ELLERLREEAGVQIEQICLIDKAFRNPRLGVKRALREFADWQSASALLRKAEVSAEVLAFGHLSDYFEASAHGGRAKGCHLFVHCDAHWVGAAEDCDRLACRSLVPGGLLARLAEGGGNLAAATQPTAAAILSAFSGDKLAQQEESQTSVQTVQLDQDSDGEEGQLAKSSSAHTGGLHMAEPFFSAAWTVVAWPPECFKPPSLQPLDHPLLSRREAKSRVRQAAEENGLSVWRVVHKPRVGVRSGPSGQAPVVDVFYTGDELAIVHISATALGAGLSLYQLWLGSGSQKSSCLCLTAMCGSLRALRLAASFADFQGTAVLIGLLDLLRPHEELLQELQRSGSTMTWVPGIGKALLVVDINARILTVFGATGNPIGALSFCWILFVLSTYILSTLLMARSIPSYCAIVVASLVGIAANTSQGKVQVAAAISAAASVLCIVYTRRGSKLA
ncbi:unnamed protein product, partial [Polarella glacialis]